MFIIFSYMIIYHCLVYQKIKVFTGIKVFHLLFNFNIMKTICFTTSNEKEYFSQKVVYNKKGLNSTARGAVVM